MKYCFMQVTKIINCDCLLKSTGELLGKVVEVVVGPTRPRLEGFVIKKNRWIGGAEVVEIERVVDFWNRNLLIKKGVASKKSRINCHRIIRSKKMVLGRRAYGLNGEKLGIVSDIYFDIYTGWIDKFVVDSGVGFWKKSRIYLSNTYVEANQKGVVFDVGGNILKVKKQVEAVEMELVS